MVEGAYLEPYEHLDLSLEQSHLQERGKRADERAIIVH